MKNLITNEVERVSVNSIGEEGNNDSFSPVISANGRFVAFVSRADNLVSNDSNGVEDIFLHDRLNRTTVRITESETGEEANDFSDDPIMSGDGRFITFRTKATNLISEGVFGGLTYDRLTGKLFCLYYRQCGGVMSYGGRFTVHRVASQLVMYDKETDINFNIFQAAGKNTFYC